MTNEELDEIILDHQAPLELLEVGDDDCLDEAARLIRDLAFYGDGSHDPDKIKALAKKLRSNLARHYGVSDDSGDPEDGKAEAERDSWVGAL